MLRVHVWSANSPLTAQGQLPIWTSDSSTPYVISDGLIRAYALCDLSCMLRRALTSIHDNFRCAVYEVNPSCCSGARAARAAMVRARYRSILRSIVAAVSIQYLSTPQGFQLKYGVCL